MFDLTIFKNLNIRRLIAAQLVSQVCEKLMLVGILWFLADRVSAPAAGWFIAVSALPHLLLARASPRLIARLGGPLRAVILTDRWRGWLMLAVAAAFLVFAGEASPFLPAALFALSFLSNCLGALFNPAILALPTLVTRDPVLLQKTTALVESCFSISAVLAPLLSTALYAGLGVSGLLAVNGVSYLFAAALESRIPIESEAPEELSPDCPRPGPLGHDPLLAAMLVSFLLINLFLGPVLVFLPLFAKQVYSGSLASLAGLEAALGAGTVAAALGVATFTGGGAGNPASLAGGALKRIGVSLGLVSLAYLAFALSRSLPAGIVAVSCLGFFLALANIQIVGFFQLRSRPEDLTSVMSRVNLISVASLPVSMTAVSLALNFLDLRSVAGSCAALVLLVTTATAALTAMPLATGAATP